MPTQLKEKTQNFVQTASTLGQVGIFIIEKQTNLKQDITKIKKFLNESGFKETADYLEIMDLLNAAEGKIFYIEKDKKLDSRVLEIIAEFQAGIVSFADVKNHTGLKVAKWNPSKTSFILIISRKQVEASYPRLFEYINIIQSI